LGVAWQLEADDYIAFRHLRAEHGVVQVFVEPTAEVLESEELRRTRGKENEGKFVKNTHRYSLMGMNGITHIVWILVEPAT
jgi:hypothetical protein